MNNFAEQVACSGTAEVTVHQSDENIYNIMLDVFTHPLSYSTSLHLFSLSHNVTIIMSRAHVDAPCSPRLLSPAVSWCFRSLRIFFIGQISVHIQSLVTQQVARSDVEWLKMTYRRTKKGCVENKSRICMTTSFLSKGKLWALNGPSDAVKDDDFSGLLTFNLTARSADGRQTVSRNSPGIKAEQPERLCANEACLSLCKTFRITLSRSSGTGPACTELKLRLVCV